MDFNITYREKDGGLQVIISYKDINGKWKQKSKQGFEASNKGKKIAANWANDTITDLKNDGTLNLNIQYENITFKEYYDLFISDRSSVLRGKTLNNYDVAIIKFKSLYDFKLKDIKTMDIQREVNKLEGYNSTSIDAYLKKLKCLFNFAVNKYEMISKNPVNNIEFTGKKSEEKKVLNANELISLLAKTKKMNTKSYYIASLLASKCGLRIGEIVGLTWPNVDFKNQNLKITQQWIKSKKGEWDFGELKSKNSYREVPMPPVVVKELKNLKKSTVIDMSTKVLKTKNTNSLSALLIQVYRELGFDISIHELRHTYATNLISNGIDFKTAAKFLGHDVSETMKTYSHVNSDMIKNAKNIINNIF